MKNSPELNKMLGETPTTFGDALAALKPRHAEVVRNLIKGMSNLDAYLLVYPKASRLAASSRICQLLAMPNIALALRLGQTETTKAIGYEVKEAIAEIDKSMRQAKDANQHSAAAKCLELKLKILGLMSEKLEITHNSPDLRGILEAANARLLPVLEGRVIRESLPAPQTGDGDGDETPEDDKSGLREPDYGEGGSA